jgi:6-phosphofructokinase 2
VPDDFYARVVRLAREHGARCIVDAPGAAFAEALTEGPFLVSPSRRELGTFFDAELDTEQNQIDAATTLIANGSAEYVALTLGAEGALLVSRDRTLRLPAPPVDAVSTVGAGDSFLAALVLRLAQKRSIEEAFRAAVAAGTAAAMRPGTELCHRADVERLEAGLLSATS